MVTITVSVMNLMIDCLIGNSDDCIDCSNLTDATISTMTDVMTMIMVAAAVMSYTVTSLMKQAFEVKTVVVAVIMILVELSLPHIANWSDQ
jgi:Na+/glutamate symporter